MLPSVLHNDYLDIPGSKRLRSDKKENAIKRKAEWAKKRKNKKQRERRNIPEWIKIVVDEQPWKYRIYKRNIHIRSITIVNHIVSHYALLGLDTDDYLTIEYQINIEDIIQYIRKNLQGT